LVLVVIGFIFKSQIGKIADSFMGIEEDAEEQGQKATSGLDNIFGCDDGAEKTQDNTEYICKDGKWEEK
jgi:hypothetical protein